MVILHYLTVLQEIDSHNEYFIHSRDPINHLVIRNQKWQNVIYSSWIRDYRIHIRDRWIKATDACNQNKNAFNTLLRLILRVLKIVFEGVDEIVFSHALIQFMKEKKIDTYISTSTYYFPSGVFSLPVKTVAILYDLVWKLYPETMEWGNRIRMKLYTKRNLKMMDLLISISENTKKDTQSLLHLRTKIVSIPLAADPMIFYKAKKSDIQSVKAKYHISKKYILTVSTLEPRKNLKTLLAAFGSMKNHHEYQLVMVGMKGWIQSDYFQYEYFNIIKDDILFTGYVPNNDLAPLYSGSELFVFPSLYEGFGLPVLEAMQCGCPVVASNNSSLPEVIGDAGMMVDATSPNELANAMSVVLNSRTIRQTLSRKGLSRAKYFSWMKSASAFKKEIESL